MASFYHIALVSLFLLASTINAQTTINCYSCSSTIYANGTEVNIDPTKGSCASLEDKTTMAYTESTGFKVQCSISYSTASLESEGQTTFSRSGATAASSSLASATYCDSSDACYCDSEKCNSQTLALGTTYTCYLCNSVEYYDNGCGDENFNPSSDYVDTVTGCSACGKMKTIKDDYSVSVMRGCAKASAFKEGCIYNLDGSSTCVCVDDSCNSAVVPNPGRATLIMLFFIGLAMVAFTHIKA